MWRQLVPFPFPLQCSPSLWISRKQQANSLFATMLLLHHWHSGWETWVLVEAQDGKANTVGLSSLGCELCTNKWESTSHNKLLLCVPKTFHKPLAVQVIFCVCVMLRAPLHHRPPAASLSAALVSRPTLPLPTFQRLLCCQQPSSCPTQQALQQKADCEITQKPASQTCYFSALIPLCPLCWVFRTAISEWTSKSRTVIFARLMYSTF